MAQTKAATSAKRKSTKRKSTKSAASKGFAGISFKGMMNDALKPLLFLLGLLAGKFVHDMIESGAQSAGATAGLAGDVKNVVKPAMIFAGGLILKQLWKGDIGTYAGYGLASYGAITIAKDMFNFNVLGQLAPGLAGANLGLLAPAPDPDHSLLLRGPMNFAGPDSY